MNWAMLVLNVSELEALVKNCAQSPIVASGISYGEFYTFLSLLKKYNHLHLETSCLQTRDFIKRAAKLLRADKILMGTVYPFKTLESKWQNIETSIFQRKTKRR
jgi:hypothetical protein